MIEVISETILQWRDDLDEIRLFILERYGMGCDRFSEKVFGDEWVSIWVAVRRMVGRIVGLGERRRGGGEGSRGVRCFRGSGQH